VEDGQRRLVVGVGVGPERIHQALAAREGLQEGGGVWQKGILFQPGIRLVTPIRLLTSAPLRPVVDSTVQACQFFASVQAWQLFASISDKIEYATFKHKGGGWVVR